MKDFCSQPYVFQMSFLEKKLPPMTTLIAFEAAFRHRNFTRAATELRLTQASISRLIRQLEENLSTRLFDRGRRDVTPTAAGEALAVTVRRCLADLALTTDQLRDAGDTDGKLTVFAELGLASHLIAPNMGAFQQRHPDVSIRIYTSAEPLEAFDQEFDVGLRSGWWAEHSYHIEPVADDAIFPVCAPAFLDRLGTSITPARIAQGPLLHWDPAATGPWPDWSDFLARFGIDLPRPMVGPSVNSYDVLLDVVERTDGFALAWARTVEDRLAAGRLARVPGMVLPLPDHIAAHFSKRKPPNPLAQEFMDLIRRAVPPLTLSDPIER